MNVLSIGTDRNIFKKGSAVRDRMIEYGSLFESLHIVVFAKKKLKFKLEQIASNVWIYPTNSLTRFQYMRDARIISEKIISLYSFSKENTVVTAQDPFETGLVGIKLEKRFNLPLQIQIHTDVFSPYFMNHSFLNMIRVQMAKKVIPHAHEIRVVSQKIKDSLIKELKIEKDKIDILPIYTEINDKSPLEQKINLHEKYPQFSQIILMVGRLESEKNYSFALDVFSEIYPQFPKVGLVIVGCGSQKKKLQKKVRSNGIQDSVIFEGSQKNVFEYYTSADVFLHTSLYEGYGMVLIEAASAQLPIVTSDVGIASELFRDGESALISPINNKDSFVKKLKTIISQEELRKIIGSQGKNVVSTRNISKEEYLNKYKSLLEKAYKHL